MAMNAQRAPWETPEPPAAPSHLSESAQALWRELVPRRVRSVERAELLRVALEARDRADAAGAAIAAEGMVSRTETTGALHVHPLVRVERENRALFAKIWSSLRLDWAPDVDGRPVR